MTYEKLKSQMFKEAKSLEDTGHTLQAKLLNDARIAIDELEFKLSHSLASLNAISENPNSNTELKKFCVTHMNEIQFNWMQYLDSIGIDGGTIKQQH